MDGLQINSAKTFGCSHISTSAAKNSRQFCFDTLEDRTLLSWGGVPSNTVTPPSKTTSVTFDNQTRVKDYDTISRNEIDFYSFVAPRSGLYQFSATTPSSNLDTVAALYDANGKRLAYNDDIAIFNRDSQFKANLTAGRRYYFGVTNYIGSAGGKYEILIQGPNFGEDDYENNDSFNQAYNLGTLSKTETVSGLVMADSQDWFQFTMKGAGQSTDYIQIDFDHRKGDLDLAVYNNHGQRILVSDSVSNNERVSLNGLAAGTYRVQVYGYRGAQNSEYDLTIRPGSVPVNEGRKILYVNFDGVSLTYNDIQRYARDWANNPFAADSIDPERNGVRVSPFLEDTVYENQREEIIDRILESLERDLRPFGVSVVRHFGKAVENVGATTVFVGRGQVGQNKHIASDVDFGNNNRTDIAFVGNETWSSVSNTATAMADVILHEVGHTYGLYHVNTRSNGVLYSETMGLRYTTSNQRDWVRDTAFVNRSFTEFSRDGGGRGVQNSYQTLRNNFANTPAFLTNNFSNSRNSNYRNLSHASNLALDDELTIPDGATNPVSDELPTEQAGDFWYAVLPNGVFQVGGSNQADTFHLVQTGLNGFELIVNDEVFALGADVREIQIFTYGDTRDEYIVTGDTRSINIKINTTETGNTQVEEKLPANSLPIWRDVTNVAADGGNVGRCCCSICSVVPEWDAPAVDTSLVTSELLSSDTDLSVAEMYPVELESVEESAAFVSDEELFAPNEILVESPTEVVVSENIVAELAASSPVVDAEVVVPPEPVYSPLQLAAMEYLLGRTSQQSAILPPSESEPAVTPEPENYQVAASITPFVDWWTVPTV